MKVFYTLCLLFFFQTTKAQSLNNFSLKDIGQSMLIVTDGNGKTVNMGLDMENYGSPFFETDFYPANVVLVNGQHYQGVDVKLICSATK